ncbi:hypothetical protein [Kitasatospora sp. NPDC094011]|uniref:hypothetical protein n=1 Tax=Kitasatospora sp. NPDC094011 TaxID=3364090 RepID=UPI00381AA3A1
MANDQSETPGPSTSENAAPTPAVAVEAGQAVEGAVAAASNPTEYTEPSADQKNALENDLFGDESDRVLLPAAPATGEPGKTYEPENVVAGHP